MLSLGIKFIYSEHVNIVNQLPVEFHDKDGALELKIHYLSNMTEEVSLKRYPIELI